MSKRLTFIPTTEGFQTWELDLLFTETHVQGEKYQVVHPDEKIKENQPKTQNV